MSATTTPWRSVVGLTVVVLGAACAGGDEAEDTVDAGDGSDLVVNVRGDEATACDASVGACMSFALDDDGRIAAPEGIVLSGGVVWLALPPGVELVDPAPTRTDGYPQGTVVRAATVTTGADDQSICVRLRMADGSVGRVGVASTTSEPPTDCG
jgi:hypothetical protein